jgi:hypothetical protein
MHELLVQWVGYVVPWIEALGIVVVLWGVLGAFMGLAQRWLVVGDAAHHGQGPGRHSSRDGREDGSWT